MPALRWSTAASAAALSAALFVLCTAVTAAGLLDAVDHSAGAALRRSAGHAADVVMAWIALPASIPLCSGWLAILAVAASHRPRWRRRVLTLAVVVVAGVAVELALKALIDHPGPYPTRGVISLGSGEVGRGSFPSGHTFRGTTLAFGTALVARPARRPVALAVAAVYSVLLACGVLFLSWHWTSDVIGGVLLGLTAASTVAAVAAHDRRTSP